MAENAENNENNEKDDHLLEEEEDRDTVQIGSVRDTTLQKIEDYVDEKPEAQKKLPSYRIVFSVWNTMIGSSIVSIPYNVYQAGIIPTIFIGLLYGYICYLTCSVVVRLGGKSDDFAEIVYNYLYYGFGKKTAKFGKIVQITFNLMINTGATFIYFLIINQNFYPCICVFLRIFGVDIDDTDLTPHFDKFSFFYCSLIVSAIAFPLTIFRDMSFLAKFNSLGIYFVSALLIFVLYTGVRTMATDTFKFEYKENSEGNNERYLYLFGENPGMLTGTLSLGLFCHSVILPLMKNNRKPENNSRDLFLGYLCVTLTYIIIGIFGYIGFSGADYSPVFKDNWFRFFPSDNYFILVLRLLNVIQLISIFPILFFVVRNQLFATFFKSFLKGKSRVPFLVFSLSLLFLCILVLCLCYDTLGKLISYIGAITALILVYTIAPLINMINYYIRHQPKKEIEKLREAQKEFNIPINVDELVPLRPWKAFIFYLCMMLIVLLGIITLILQIMPVNFFGITIEKNQ